MQEAGFSVLELNASDTRSKKSLKQEVAELLGNQTLTGATTARARLPLVFNSPVGRWQRDADVAGQLEVAAFSVVQWYT